MGKVHFCFREKRSKNLSQQISLHMVFSVLKKNFQETFRYRFKIDSLLDN